PPLWLRSPRHHWIAAIRSLLLGVAGKSARRRRAVAESGRFTPVSRDAGRGVAYAAPEGNSARRSIRNAPVRRAESLQARMNRRWSGGLRKIGQVPSVLLRGLSDAAPGGSARIRHPAVAASFSESRFRKIVSPNRARAITHHTRLDARWAG